MTDTRWQRLQDLFHGALALSGAERETFLADACRDDPGLRADLDRLLNAHERPGGIMGRGIVEEASAVGRRFGPYRATRELGRGGMGAVYLGERADGQFEQLVAIKVIKRGMDTEQVLSRFQQERRILASLEHPNIARLLDGGTTEDGQPYFVMEYIDGQPIDVYADAHTLTVGQRLELFLQVAGAVSYAHQHLIVHRDIKPLNILVTASGVPKLLDFGIAKVLHADEEDLTATVTGWRLLTPEYASPEQVQGLPATTASDVYSLGVVLFELLTGRSPYRLRSRTPQDLAVAVCTTEPPRPSTVVRATDPDTAGRQRPGVTADRAAAMGAGSAERLQRRLRGDLDTIVLTALRKEPQRRYQSVEQFAADIRRHLDGRPVRARPDTFRYRAGKFVRRNAVPVTAGVLVLLALVAGILATTWQARQAREAQARAERRFADVRRMANTLLFDYHDAIRDLRGATPVRERLLRDALGYLDGLAREQGDDRALQRELAAAYRRVGDLQGGDPKGLGDTKGAVESYGKALAILEELHRADSTDVRTRRELAELATLLGSMVWERGDLRTGTAHAERAHGILVGLAAAAPADSTLRLALHNAKDLLGQLALEAGDPTTALAFHRQDLAQMEQAPESQRRWPALRRAISVAYGHLADAQYDLGDLAAAFESHRRSYEIRSSLAAEFPDNAEYEYLSATARYYMGTVLGRMERWGESLALHQQNLARDSTDAFKHFRVGEALAKLGRHAEGLAHYRHALAHHQKQFGDDSTSLYHRLAIAADLGGICSTMAALRRPGAREACRRAAAYITATRVEETHAWPRAHFAAIWFDLGGAYEAMADPITARDTYRRSAEIWTDLSSRELLSPIDTVWLRKAVEAAARVDGMLASRAASANQ